MMKRFLRNIFIFSGILCLVFISIFVFDIFVIKNQYTNVYTAAILDKVERLQSIQGPKIILVGNSNLSFGIDSAKMEEELGMPVVNLGLHGGLGNSFHEEMAKFGINNGDIVVVCHTEYDGDEIQDPVLAWTTLEKHWELWKIVRKEDLGSIVRGYPRYFLNAAKNWILQKDVPVRNDCYSRLAFNEYGDVVVRPNQDSVQYRFEKGSTKVPTITETSIERMNKFYAYIQDKGATMLVSFYPIASGEFSPAEEEYRAFQSELEKRLDCEIISDICDYFIPYEYFYDTIYHLDDNGAALRTEQLIEDLKIWMNKN